MWVMCEKGYLNSWVSIHKRVLHGTDQSTCDMCDKHIKNTNTRIHN